jgi:hypothetical protein
MVGTKKDWKSVETALEEIIKDDSRRPTLYSHWDKEGAFDIASSLGTIHMSILGTGAFGKVWKV